jgi:hypothetical protein
MELDAYNLAAVGAGWLVADSIATRRRAPRTAVTIGIG